MAELMYTVKVAAGVSSLPGLTAPSVIDVRLRIILVNDFEWKYQSLLRVNISIACKRRSQTEPRETVL